MCEVRIKRIQKIEHPSRAAEVERSASIVATVDGVVGLTTVE